ncbi:MAG: Dot/Icm T4SS effector Wip [Legionella sp.]
MTITHEKEAYKNFVTVYEEMGTIAAAINKAQNIINSESSKITGYDKRIARHKVLEENKNKTEAEEQEFSKINLTNLQKFKTDANRIKEEAVTEKADLIPKLGPLVEKFEHFMEQLTVVDKKALVRLIGDELADRGSNDYFTLRVLGLLKSAGVVVHVTISNHSNEFITAYERLAKKQGFSAKDDIGDLQKMSFVGLKLLMEQGLVTEADVSKLVNDAYKPTLRVIDYELSDDGINLFSHAPVSFEMIKHVAAKMKVAYADSSKEALAATIDKINTKFMQEVNENCVHEWCKMTDDEQDQELNRDNMTAQQMQDYPLINLIWNRWTDAKDIAEARPANHNGYKINYLHGHDGHQSKYANVVNLDTDCGKRARSEASKNQAIGSESNMPDPDKVYKVWDSSGRGLDQKHSLELIDKEFMQQQSMSNTARAGIISGVAAGIGLLLGAAIGIALVATGVFAPLGLGVLGIVAMAAILGGGASLVAGGLAFSVAKVSEAAPVTTTLIEDAEPLIEKSSLSVMASGLGSAQVEPASQSTNSPGQEPEPQSQSQANVVATAESNPDEVHEAHSCSPK